MDFTINSNVITAYGTINDGDGIAFSNLFQQIENNKKDIIVKLHTYGGSVFDGNLIYNTIANSVANVQIHIVGIAASMGAIISLSTDKVFIVENGYMMIHAPSGGVYGTANDLESNIKLMRSMEQNFISKLLEKTGKNQEYVKNWLVGDNWFDANQALQEGLVSGIIESETKINKNFNPNQLGAVAVYNRFSALLKHKTNINLNNDNMDLREQLIKKLRLRKNVSDTAIFNALEEQELETSTLKDSLIELLGLEADVSDEDILKSIESLIQSGEETKEEKKVEANLLISDALKKGKIVPSQKGFISNMFVSNFKEAKEFLNNIPERVSITSQIKAVQDNKVSSSKRDWGIDEYRKFAPKDLANDPELYQRLLKAKYNTK